MKKKKVNKTLREISKEIVEIANNEDTTLDASEKVLEHLAYNLHLSEDYKIKIEV